jgi:hypothetical protein
MSLPLHHFYRMPVAQEAVLDSNLLLLWLAASIDPPLWKWKRIQMFDVEDALLLNRILARFRSISTTPHVLTEVSNLANQLHGPHRQTLFLQLGAYARSTPEHFSSSSSLSSRPEFVRLGITDCALSEVGPASTVMTADYRLAGHLESSGKSVVNFNLLRQSRLFS